MKMIKNWGRLLILSLMVASCSTEEIQEENTPEGVNSEATVCRVWSDDYITEDESYFDYVGKIYGNVVGINEETDDDGRFFKLGFIRTENSQNPGEVWALVNPTDGTWRKLNSCRGSNIAGFWDTLSKNNSEDARIIQQGTDKNKVFLFYNNAGRTYLQFRVDNGEVLKINGIARQLPGGFKAHQLFFHDSNRADFPANWLGIKGKKMYNFGTSLRNTPSLIRVRRNGYNGTDLNRNIRKIQGYWPFNKQRIRIEMINGTVYTLQKERRAGENYYKS